MKSFTYPRLCAAIVDRLTFAGQIIETGVTTELEGLEGLDGGAVIFESTVDSRSPWMRAGFRSGGQVRLTGELVERGLVCVGRGAQLRRPGRCGIDEFCQGSS